MHAAVLTSHLCVCAALTSHVCVRVRCLPQFDLAQDENECPQMPEFTVYNIMNPMADYPCGGPAIDTLPPTDMGMPPEMPPEDILPAASPMPSA